MRKTRSCSITDLAQACRAHYPKPAGFVLWLMCELAIIACDLAEVIGTAMLAAARQKDLVPRPSAIGAWRRADCQTAGSVARRLVFLSRRGRGRPISSVAAPV
jgi:hypothetical protein